jgi:hypothetical protein
VAVAIALAVLAAIAVLLWPHAAKPPSAAKPTSPESEPPAPPRPRAAPAASGSTHEEARLAQEIEAHVRLGNIGHARSLADRFYRAFPGSAEIGRIERLTGYHPRPYGP